MKIEREVKKNIFCVFTTNLGESYKIPKSAINIKTESTNEDLNSILHQILKINKKPKNDIFDFLFMGEIIKGDLKSYLIKQNKSGEENIQLEYIIARGEPQLKNSQNLDNWVNKIFVQEESVSSSALYYSCLFNGTVEILDDQLKKMEKICLLEKEDDMSQNVLTFGFFEDAEFNFIFASNYLGELYGSKVNKESYQFNTKYLDCCNSAFSSILVDPLNPRFFTGDNEGFISSWNFDNKNLSTKKTNENNIHQTSIHNMTFLNEFEIMTASLDDSLKIVDMNNLKPIFEMYFKDSTVSCFDFNQKKNLILTGHVKGGIKTFDERVRNKIAKDVFISHNAFVSQVKVVENSENFVSSCYEGFIKIWDYRMDLPIFSINCHEGKKVFALECLNSDEFLSGGEDNQIIKHSLK